MVSPAKIKQYGLVMKETGLVRVEMEGLTLVASEYADYAPRDEDEGQLQGNDNEFDLR